MFKMRLRSPKNNTPYLYRFNMECAGRSIEFGIRHQDVLTVKSRAQKAWTTFQGITSSVKTIKTSTKKATSRRPRSARPHEESAA